MVTSIFPYLERKKVAMTIPFRFLGRKRSEVMVTFIFTYQEGKRVTIAILT